MLNTKKKQLTGIDTGLESLYSRAAEASRQYVANLAAANQSDTEAATATEEAFKVTSQVRNDIFAAPDEEGVSAAVLKHARAIKKHGINVEAIRQTRDTQQAAQTANAAAQRRDALNAIGATRRNQRLTDAITGRIDNVTGRLDNVNASIGNVTGRLDNVNVSLGDVANRIDNVAYRINDLGYRVDNVGNRVIDVGTQLGDVITGIDTVAGNVNAVRDRVGDTVTGLENVAYRVREAGDRSNDVAARIIDLNNNILRGFDSLGNEVIIARDSITAALDGNGGAILTGIDELGREVRIVADTTTAGLDFLGDRLSAGLNTTTQNVTQAINDLGQRFADTPLAVQTLASSDPDSVFKTTLTSQSYKKENAINEVRGRLTSAGLDAIAINIKALTPVSSWKPAGVKNDQKLNDIPLNDLRDLVRTMETIQTNTLITPPAYNQALEVLTKKEREAAGNGAPLSQLAPVSQAVPQLAPVPEAVPQLTPTPQPVPQPAPVLQPAPVPNIQNIIEETIVRKNDENTRNKLWSTIGSNVIASGAPINQATILMATDPINWKADSKKVKNRPPINEMTAAAAALGNKVNPKALAWLNKQSPPQAPPQTGRGLKSQKQKTALKSQKPKADPMESMRVTKRAKDLVSELAMMSLPEISDVLGRISHVLTRGEKEHIRANLSHRLA